MDNAIRFTPEGGGVVLRSHRGRRPVGWWSRWRTPGVGIEPEALPRIFDAFEQAERTVRGGRGGLGLGLSLSRRLVEMHGGTPDGRQPGPGPGRDLHPGVAHDRRRPRGGSSPPPTPRRRGGPGLSILLVEDHEDTLRVICRLLRTAGLRRPAARSVGEALELAEGERFDLLVSDLDLPDGSGLEVMRSVKERHGLRGIAMSGFGRDADIQRCREAGFEVHLTKPVDFDTLKLKIESIVA